MTTNPPAVEDVVRVQDTTVRGFMVALLRTAVDASEDVVAAGSYQTMDAILRAAGALPVEPLPEVGPDLVDEVVAVLGMPYEDELARLMLGARDTHELAETLPAVHHAARAAGYSPEAQGFAAFRVAMVLLRLSLCPTWRATDENAALATEILDQLRMYTWADKLTMYDLPAEVYSSNNDWREPLAHAPDHGWSVAHITDNPSQVDKGQRRIWWRAHGLEQVEWFAEELVSGYWRPVADLPRRRHFVDGPGAVDELTAFWREWLTERLPKRKPQRAGFYLTEQAPGREEIVWYCDGKYWHLVARSGRSGPRLELSDNPGRWDRCPAGKAKRLI